jgi:glycosyltransferase involved in cell wall biosynthesis
MSQPETSLSLEFFVDGRRIGTSYAGEYRRDLKAGSLSKGRHGFRHMLPPSLLDAREHMLDIRPKKTSTSIPGMPRRAVLGSKLLAGYVRQGSLIHGFATFRGSRRKLRLRIAANGRSKEILADKKSGLPLAAGLHTGDCGFSFDLCEMGLSPECRDEEFCISTIKPTETIGKLQRSGILDRTIDFNVEHFKRESVSGWAWRPADDQSPLMIELLMDDLVVATTYADAFRQDLKETLKRDGLCAFNMAVPRELPIAGPVWVSLRAKGSKLPFYIHPELCQFAAKSLTVRRADSLCIEGEAYVPDSPMAAIDLDIVVGDLTIPVPVVDGRFKLELARALGESAPRGEVSYSIRCGTEQLASGMIGELLPIDATNYAVLEKFDQLVARGRVLSRAGDGVPTARVELTVNGASIKAKADKTGFFDLNYSDVDIADGDHAVGLEITLPRKRSAKIRRLLSFKRLEAELLEVSGSVIVGYAKDLRLPDRVLTLDVVIDGVAIATVQANESLPKAPKRAGKCGFRLALSPEWLDGREHVIELRLAGSGELLTDEPELAVFGEPKDLFQVHVERTEADEITGWAVFRLRPASAVMVKLRRAADGTTCATSKANEPSKLLQMLHLPPRHGFRLPLHPAEQRGRFTLELVCGEHRHTVPLPDEQTGPESIRAISSDQDRSGVCVVLPNPAVDSQSQETMLSLLSVARTAADAAHDVTLVLPSPSSIADQAIDLVFGSLSKEPRSRCVVVVLPARLPIGVSSIPSMDAAVALDFWARTKAFQVIVGAAHKGVLTSILDTQAQGSAYQSTKVIAFAERLTVPERFDNFLLTDEANHLFNDSLERNVVARANVVVFPNRAMLESARKLGISGSGGSRILSAPFSPWLSRLLQQSNAEPTQTEVSDAATVLVLGGTDCRNAVNTICDAFDRLAATAARESRQLSVVFLGSGSAVFGVDAQTYVSRRADNWPFSARIFVNAAPSHAIGLISQKRKRVLALVPAEAEGSVLDTAGRRLGLPRLTLRPTEFESDETWPDSIARNPSLLVDSLLRWIRGDEAFPVRPAKDSDKEWKALFEPIVPTAKAQSKGSEQTPLVSVCISTFNRPSTLWQTLKSLEADRYPNKEIVVVDDGSDWAGVADELDGVEEWLKHHNGRLVRQENRYLGATRNTAVRHASGDLILFMDDDNLAAPDMVTGFVDAWRRTGADALTAVFFMFEGNALVDPAKTWPQRLGVPLGPDASLGALTNCFGDANMLVTRKAFEAVGGFTEDFGSTHEDWELLARLTLNGFRVERLTVPLFWYRVSPNSMLRTRAHPGMNLLRNIRAYRDEMTPETFRWALLAQGLLTRWDKPSLPSSRPTPVSPSRTGRIGSGRVAVITRTKNRPILLERAIRSVLSQSCQDWVHVIINDGGDPRVVDELVEQFAKDYRGRCLAVHNTESLGMENASNVGIARSESEFLVIHDDDDTWEPLFLDRCIDYLDNCDPTIGGVISHATVVIEEMSIDGTRELDRFPYDNPASIEVTKLFEENCFPPICFLFRRTALEFIGRFDGQYTALGDWDFNLRFQLHFDIGILQEPLANYHHRRAGSGSGAYGNSVVERRGEHRLNRAKLINAKVKSDLAADRFGEGALLFLGDKFLDMGKRLDEIRSAMDRLGHLESARSRANARSFLDLYSSLSSNPPGALSGEKSPGSSPADKKGTAGTKRRPKQSRRTFRPARAKD